MHDLVIENASIIDGTGRPACPGSVAVADGRIREGDLVLMDAMGGGFTWGSALVRW